MRSCPTTTSNERTTHEADQRNAPGVETPRRGVSTSRKRRGQASHHQWAVVAVVGLLLMVETVGLLKYLSLPTPDTRRVTLDAQPALPLPDKPFDPSTPLRTGSAESRSLVLFLAVNRGFKNDKAKPGKEDEKRGNRYPFHYKSSSSLMRA
jgi:hypothetical protein